MTGGCFTRTMLTLRILKKEEKTLPIGSLRHHFNLVAATFL